MCREVVAGGTALKDGIVVFWRGGLTGVVSKSKFVFIFIYVLSHPYLSGLWLSVGAASHVVVSGCCVLVACAFGAAIFTGVVLFGYQVSVGPAITSTVRETAEAGVALVVVVAGGMACAAIAVVVVTGAAKAIF